MRAKTIKLLEECISVHSCDLGLGNGFLDMAPKAQATKEKNRKLECIKIKLLCFKGHYRETKNTTDGRKYLQSYI